MISKLDDGFGFVLGCAIALTLFILFLAWHADIPLYGKIFVVSLWLAASMVVLLKPSPKSVSVPETAKKIFLPSGETYLRVWKEENAVNMVFSRMPFAKVRFAKEISEQLSEALKKI